MALVTTKLVFDMSMHEGAIQYFLDGELMTQWAYESDVLVADAIVASETTRATAYANTLVNLQFIDFIEGNFGPPSFPQSEYVFELEKDADEVRMRIVIGGQVLIDATWYAATDLMSFGARPALSLVWPDYRLMMDAAYKFQQAVIDFGKGA